MDFTAADDELDYEEDGLDLLKNNSESVNCLENGVSRDENFPSCEEDYLQINCSEEDEDFISGEQLAENNVVLDEKNSFVSDVQPSGPLGSENPPEETSELQNVQKDDGSGNAKQKIFIRGELCTQTNSSNFSNANGSPNKKKLRKRKSAWFFQRRSAVQKKLITSLSFHPWLPAYGFSEPTVKHSPVAPYDNRFLRPHLNCPPSATGNFPLASFGGAFQLRQTPQQGQLTADEKRFASPNSPIGMAVNGLSQQRFGPLMSESATVSGEGVSELKTDERNSLKSSGCGDGMQGGVSLNNEKFSYASFVQENINVVWRQGRENFIQNHRAGELKGEHGNTLEGSLASRAPLSKNGWECKDENSVSFLNEQEKCPVKINAFKEEEKELVKLKKEARRKRFMQDDIIGKGKELLESFLGKRSDNSLPRERDFLKMKESKILEEKFQGREDQDCKSDQGFMLEKGNLKKELLLKKRNPFDGKTEMTTCVAGTKIKQEVFCCENLKTEQGERSLLKEAKEEKQAVEGGESKVLSGFCSNGPGLFNVKNETGSRVKFVRTISKSLHELGFGKSKTELVSEGSEGKPFALKALPFASEDTQEQVMPQLMGRVVKVLNIPPSTTTNNILSLCSGIGIVREVKLNFPKENSAVIRFAEASSAENFFSLYHGQKMDNYFLNVIII